MELKSNFTLRWWRMVLSSNRTFMELKSEHTEGTTHTTEF